MFESAFALDTPARRSPLLVSLTMQAAAVATMVLLPLFYIEQLTELPSMPVPVYSPKLPHMKIISVMREAAAAMEAVRQWRYRPTTLNGEAVEVLTQIDVNFTLSQ